MVNIKLYKNGLIVSGHANYNQYNKDILCAGISAIIIGSLNWFDNHKCINKLIKNDGYIYLSLHNNNNSFIGLSFIKTQIESIYYNPVYKPYISYKLIDIDIEEKKDD